MVELGNIKIITGAIPAALIWHMQLNVFSFFKTTLQSVLCVCLCLLDKQESNSCHLCIRMMFNLPCRLMGARQLRSYGFLHLFYIRFGVLSYKRVDVQCSLSSTVHENRQAEVLKLLYTHTQVHRARTGRLGIN